uniref:ZP domain-containing protein n=1 Tax=Parastrongyloides trichosuri TaxID=131310 RepID=A0A0N4ZCW2_PARTI
MLLLFMMLLQYGYGNDRELFEQFNITNERNPPFPFEYDVETGLDLVLVRCPGHLFEYEPNEVTFGLSTQALEYKMPILENSDRKTAWRIAIYDDIRIKNFTYTCAELTPKGDFLKQRYDWNIKLTWTETPGPLLTNVTKANLDVENLASPFECLQEDSIKLVKHLDGKAKIEEYKHRETEIFRNELIYIFGKGQLDTPKSLFVPCGITQQ